MSARRNQIVALAVGLAVAALLQFDYAKRLERGVSPHEKLDSQLLNGSYRNGACGEIRLAEGRAFIGSASVPFSLVNIKGKLLILPEGTIEFDQRGGTCFPHWVAGQRF